jgi:23S rRNA (guanine745-N1)-methyltransferase
MLVCPVAGCHLPLTREDRRLVCPRHHSFDIARSGYINLLQPQDRRSHEPGDTAAAIAGRRRLHDTGATRPLFDAIAALAAATSADTVLDTGCGEGFFLGTLARETGCASHGIDISIRAVDAAARRYPNCQWIVANADRFVSYADRSFSLILSITARVNPAEFWRVLRDDGRVLIAVPAPDDLHELRGPGHDRVTRTVESMTGFTLTGQNRVTTAADLDAAIVQDVLHSIYRPMRSAPPAAMRLTFSLDLLLFSPSGASLDKYSAV